jgi:hypothetical protein
MTNRQEPIFPPLILEAGRPQWTPKDKLARLVEMARKVGYFSDQADCPSAETTEERALFAELAGLLGEGADQKQRADHLAEALHGSYGTEHRWKLAYEGALGERDEARKVARDAFSNLRERSWHSSLDRWLDEWPWLEEPNAPDPC